jgi:hypothetical protein
MTEPLDEYLQNKAEQEKKQIDDLLDTIELCIDDLNPNQVTAFTKAFRALNSPKWGEGDTANIKPFGKTFMGNEEVQLFHGEHPHSRNDNNTYARTKQGYIYGFDGHRVLIDITFKTNNYLKSSGISGDEIRKSGECIISADREPIYAFGFREINWALNKAGYLLTVLSEHSSGILVKSERDKLPGRKIYYDRTPAIITRLVHGDVGTIIIEAEHGHNFPQPIYSIENDEIDEDHDDKRIKEDILSNKIWWHRS